MRPNDLARAVAFAIKSKLPILIKGAPGIGKSDIVASACKEAGADLIISHPVVSDPTDYKGLPFPSEDCKEAVFLPFGELNRIINADKPTVFFLDDLGQAPMSVQAAAMQLILARRVNGHKVSNHVVFIAATNRREDRAGVSGILEPVKSRFAAIVELTPDLDDWVAWARENNMPPELISFIRFKPTLLHDFKPTGDITNTPCPRTVAYVGKIINANPPEGVLYGLVEGAAGSGFAAEFNAYLTMYSKIPKLEDFISKPDTLDVPKNPGELYAYSGFITANLTTKNIPQLMKYINRMPKEFSVLIMKDVTLGKNSVVTNTKEYAEWLSANASLINSD